MKAADVMTRRVITTTADASINGVARLMVLHRISDVPVGDGAGGVIGMITEGDLLRRAETVPTSGTRAGSGCFLGRVVLLKNTHSRMRARLKKS